MKFNKYPFIKICNELDWCIIGWEQICTEIQQVISSVNSINKVVVSECYQGVYIDETNIEHYPLFMIMFI